MKLPPLPWIWHESLDGNHPVMKKQNNGWGGMAFVASDDYLIAATSGWDQELCGPEEHIVNFLNYLLASDEACIVMDRYIREQNKSVPPA